MDRVVRLPEAERRELFTETATQRGMTPSIVEKDFWVCWVLDRLFRSPLGEILLFKGDTSLSKVYGLIERFSEDIDLVLDPQVLGLELSHGLDDARYQRDQASRRLLRDNSTYLRETFVPSLRELVDEFCEVQSLHERVPDERHHPRVIQLRYPATFSPGYQTPEIKLEISPLALALPFEHYTIQSYSAQSFPQLFIRAKCPVRAIKAERTFWEKATILHTLVHLPRDRSVPRHHSRHLYDLAQMAKATVRQQSLEALYLLPEVADFKATYYYQPVARYDLARDPQSLKLVPEARVLRELERDFRSMREMIYGEVPDFSAIVDQLRELEAEVNRLSIQ